MSHLMLSNLHCNVSTVPEFIVSIDQLHTLLFIVFELTMRSKKTTKSKEVFYIFERVDLVSLCQSLGNTCWDFLKHYDNFEDALSQTIANESICTIWINNSRMYPLGLTVNKI